MSCSYGNELDVYSKSKKLYISTELKSVKENKCSFIYNHIIVRYKEETIIDTLIKEKRISDSKLLKMIKRQINLKELGI